MDIKFNKEQQGNVYDIEMSKEFWEDFEIAEREKLENEREFSQFLKENNIKI